MSTPPVFVLGIDLGTTNCSLSAVPTAEVEGQHPSVEQFAIPQLVNPGEVRPLPLLPSCLFLPGAADFPQGSTALPWDQNPPYVVGQLAKSRGAEVPHRVILSAKSWLSWGGVDRTAPILPIAAGEGETRLSPAEASRRYLEHLKQAWNQAHPEAPLESQQVLVTVPASFDAVARELTGGAATAAGFGDVVLLEEPQAAFYAWIERHPDWRKRVKPGDLILVVDVGGGTTDFSLIAVSEAGGELQLERVAVGEHILLGGDNMDLALAHFVQQNGLGGRKLDSAQFSALWQACRNAKENLLSGSGAPKDQPITILGRGSSLIGGSLKAKLTREDAERVVTEGFFPLVPSDEMPARQSRAALAEIGLPYATDAAVTRHLARFLRQSSKTPGALAAPTHVLFNGGVFGAASLRERLLATLSQWLTKEGKPPAAALEGEDLMQAVSRGAAYYGLARRGRGVRIRGGIARTYYIGVETSMPAVPGMPPPMKALTVAQFGMEEGTKAQVASRPFALLVGEEAEFRFYGSSVRKDDPPGLLLEDVPADLEELAPVRVTLPAGSDAVRFVHVTLETEIKETGQLELWCAAKDGRRWKLEFDVREKKS